MKKKKINKKAFTLLELLAVLIILGIILIIAVPSTSKYIQNSKMKTYKSNLEKYIDAVRTEVNSYQNEDYKFSNDEYLVVPLSCIQLEAQVADKSPFSTYNKDNSFVLVVRNNDDYEYYVSALDSSGYGTKIADSGNVKIEKLDVDSAGVLTATRVDLGDEKNVALGLHNKEAKITTCSSLGELSDLRLMSVLVSKNKVLDANGLNASHTAAPGLYSTNVNTQDNKTTYFYRGAVDNNYVSFGARSNGKCVYYNKGNEEYQEVKSGVYHDEITSEEECLSGNVYFHDSFIYVPVIGFSSVDNCTNVMNSSLGIDDGAEIYCNATNEKASWVPDNYIWRIVRINEDGSIRLILEDSISYGKFFDVKEYEIEEELSANDPVATELTNWYNDNLSQYSGFFANSGYCYYDFAAFDWDRLLLNIDVNQRLFNGYTLEPQFGCSRRIQNSNGFGAQIGLLTADEAVYAGVCSSGSDTCPSYLYDNLYYHSEYGERLTNGFLTMSPLDKDWDYPEYVTFAAVGENGLTSVGTNDVKSSLGPSGLRPVINLRADIEIESGDGTYLTPYIIKTN